ncbi:hypothetical protein FXO38_02337, partial [Capsicum annuum]
GDPGEAGQPSCASTPLSTAISSLSPIGNTGSFAVSGVPTVRELGYGRFSRVMMLLHFQ